MYTSVDSQAWAQVHRVKIGKGRVGVMEGKDHLRGDIDVAWSFDLVSCAGRRTFSQCLFFSAVKKKKNGPNVKF